jgi:hypothetical protein
VRLRAYAGAALRWLDKTPPDLAEVRDALAGIVSATDRAGDVVNRIGALMRKAPPRKEILDLNEAIRPRASTFAAWSAPLGPDRLRFSDLTG